MLSRNILKTLKYSEYFDFPIILEELHLWLISSKVIPLSKIKLQKIEHPYFIKSFNKLRITRAKNFQQKERIAHKFSSLIKFIPTINLIALTGSLAVKNVKEEDDIDLMIITSQNTLWLTRPVVVILASIFFKRRAPKILNIKSEISNSICLNLWLDDNALRVPKTKQNLYTAHEVLQIKPLFDRGGCYQKFIQANLWTKKFLANAYENKKSPLRDDRTKHSDGEILALLNKIAFHIQYLYMKRKITKETITLHSAYFHPRDLSNKITNRVE